MSQRDRTRLKAFAVAAAAVAIAAIVLVAGATTTRAAGARRKAPWPRTARQSSSAGPPAGVAPTTRAHLGTPRHADRAKLRRLLAELGQRPSLASRCHHPSSPERLCSVAATAPPARPADRDPSFLRAGVRVRPRHRVRPRDLARATHRPPPPGQLSRDLGHRHDVGGAKSHQDRGLSRMPLVAKAVRAARHNVIDRRSRRLR